MTHTQFKAIVVVFLVVIVYNLFRGLYFLVTGKEKGKGTARALSWRIGLSMALFMLLVALKLLGIVEPHGLHEQSSLSDTTNQAPHDEAKTLEEIERENNDGRVRLKP